MGILQSLLHFSTTEFSIFYALDTPEIVFRRRLQLIFLRSRRIERA